MGLPTSDLQPSCSTMEPLVSGAIRTLFRSRQLRGYVRGTSVTLLSNTLTKKTRADLVIEFAGFREEMLLFDDESDILS